MAVCRILLTEAGGDAFAAQLYELLGDSAVEEMVSLVDQRRPLTAAVRAGLQKVGRGCPAVCWLLLFL
jgi:hypothetical protein